MKVLKVHPLQDRVLVERTETVPGSASILTPDSSKEAPVTGVVIDVGPGKTLEDGRVIPVSVSRGQVVLFAKYGGAPVDLGPGQEYLMLREDEIMGLVDEVEEADEEVPNEPDEGDLPGGL